MSRIYKALEKAQREREEKEDPFLFLDAEKTDKVEEILPKPIVMEGTISNHKLVSYYQPGCLASEQFRKLRTHLIRMRITNPPKTIMITSATKNEGKTFISANLAAGIALDLRAQALLVDCDLRNPTVAKWFNLLNDKGLSDYLVGNAKVSELFIKTEIEKLSLLPGGSVSENPAELIGSKKMETLFHELKSRYGDWYVIFDSTPLLATTEPEVLAKLVDGIVIVVRAGVTPRETVQQAIRNLDKEKIIGVVLNDVTFMSSGLYSRYFGSDRYYYKYGYHGYGIKRHARHPHFWERKFWSIKKSN